MKRNPAIELLRCLLMFFIVLSHSAHHGLWHGDESQKILIFVFTGLLNWHVDGFVAISGLYGIKFSWRKFLRLWGMCAFATGLSVLFSLKTGIGWRPSLLVVNGGWFVGTYMMLMLMAPFLESAIDAIVARGRQAVISTWGLVVVGTVLSWLPVHLLSAVAPSGAGGISFLCMMFVYVTARFAAKLNIKVDIKCFAYVLLLFVACEMLMVAGLEVFYSMIGKPVRWCSEILYVSSYCAPYVWLFGIALVFYFAQHIRLPAAVARVVSFVAPSMLGVYLLHATTSFGDHSYGVIEKFFTEQMKMDVVPSVVSAAVVIYCSCLLLDMFRRGGVLLISRIIKKFV